MTRHPGLAERLGLTAVQLGGVGPDAIDAFAQALVGPGSVGLVRSTRALGSPLHAEEELRAHALGIRAPRPDTLPSRVAAKIAALSPYARWALRAASLFGGAFCEQDLTAVLGQRDPAATRRALLELALFDVVVASEGSTFRIKSRLDAEVARALMSTGDAAVGARVVARVTGTGSAPGFSA